MISSKLTPTETKAKQHKKSPRFLQKAIILLFLLNKLPCNIETHEKYQNNSEKEPLEVPNKYLFFCGDFGRWGNRQFEIKGALKLAETLNRSLVLSKYFSQEDTGRDIVFSEYLELPQIQKDLQKASKNVKIKVIEWKEYKNQPDFTLPEKVYVSRHFEGFCGRDLPQIRSLPFVKMHKYEDLETDNDRIMAISGEIAFFAYYHKNNNYVIHVKKCHFERMKSYLEEKGFFNGQKTLGIHIRRGDFDGIGPDLERFLRRAASKKRVLEAEKVLIATDANSSEAERIKEFFPSALFGTGAICADYFCPLYDQMALSMTDNFMGTAKSTFSRMVMEYRAGKGKETNFVCC